MQIFSISNESVLCRINNIKNKQLLYKFGPFNLNVNTNVNVN